MFERSKHPLHKIIIQAKSLEEMRYVGYCTLILYSTQFVYYYFSQINPLNLSNYAEKYSPNTTWNRRKHDMRCTALPSVTNMYKIVELEIYTNFKMK